MFYLLAQIGLGKIYFTGNLYSCSFLNASCICLSEIHVYKTLIWKGTMPFEGGNGLYLVQHYFTMQRS